jgi:hypothetical protein
MQARAAECGRGYSRGNLDLQVYQRALDRENFLRRRGNLRIGRGPFGKLRAGSSTPQLLRDSRSGCYAQDDKGSAI